jgi:hypothetical protein
MQKLLCDCGKPVYYIKAGLCKSCYERNYRKTEKYKQHYKKYYSDPETQRRIKEYHHKPSVKKRIREYNKIRWGTDPVFRERRLKSIKKYRANKGKELYLKRKLGNPEKIKNICLEHGLSEEISDAIAVDGVVLETVMKKRGIIN